MDILAVVLAVAAQLLLPIAILYRLVARHDEKIEQTATPEMWDRPLSWWTNHQKKETATRDGVTAPRDRRIADTAATTKSNASSQV
jgi:hypothetical protein